MGFGKTGIDGDPMVNENYNWTGVRNLSTCVVEMAKEF